MRTNRLKSANFALFLCIICLLTANFAVSAANLEYNQLELKSGKTITFVSLSKLDRDTLKVVLENGKLLKIRRSQLSDAEVKRRLGAKFAMKYGRAYAVKSKLPRDFDPDEFKKSLTVSYKDMELCEYNAVKAAWKKLLEDDTVDSIDDLFLPDNPVMKYYCFVPDKENLPEGEKVPLVIFLHGMTDQQWMDKWPQDLIFVQDEVQKNYPCYFIAPLTPGKGGEAWYMSGQRDDYKYDNLQMVVGIIDEMINKYPDLDEDRIYVTGLSSGGIGTWGLLALYPSKFAGGVPIASGWDLQLKNFKHKQKIAIWAFMNPAERDDSRIGAVKLLKRAAELGADARYTKFQVAKYLVKPKPPKKKKRKNKKPQKTKKTKIKFGHAAQVWAYAEPDLIPWLFAHRRQRRP